MQVEQVDYSLVKLLSSQAAKERVSLRDDDDTTWFGIKGDNDSLMAVGAVTVKRGKARLRGIFVKPAYRGKGLGKKVTDRLIEHAEGYGCSYADLVSVKPDFWLQQGWTPKSQMRDGKQWFYRVL